MAIIFVPQPSLFFGPALGLIVRLASRLNSEPNEWRHDAHFMLKISVLQLSDFENSCFYFERVYLSLNYFILSFV